MNPFGKLFQYANEPPSQEAFFIPLLTSCAPSMFRSYPVEPRYTSARRKLCPACLTYRGAVTSVQSFPTLKSVEPCSLVPPPAQSATVPENCLAVDDRSQTENV